MGVISHDCIIATTWDQSAMDIVKEWIADEDNVPQNFQKLFVFGDSVINGYMSVVMLPDGSKEDWEDSPTGDRIRTRFIGMIKRKFLYDDGSNKFDFIEVRFGEMGSSVVGTNCTDLM